MRRAALTPVSFKYADGTLVRDGDQVLIERGTTPGTVLEIVDIAEVAKSLNVQGRGIVVDAEPRGLVFLSRECVTEDPPHFQRRGPNGRVRFLARSALLVGGVLLIPALVSLASAIHSAVTTGEVMVIAVGRTDTRIESAPWLQGWARFAAPPVLLLAVWLSAASSRWSRSWHGGSLLSGLGLLMLLESWWFTKWTGSVLVTLLWVGFVLLWGANLLKGERHSL